MKMITKTKVSRFTFISALTSSIFSMTALGASYHSSPSKATVKNQLTKPDAINAQQTKRITFMVDDALQPHGTKDFPRVVSICGQVIPKNQGQFTNWNNQLPSITIAVPATQTTCNVVASLPGYTVKSSSADLAQPTQVKVVKLSYTPYELSGHGQVKFHYTFPYTSQQTIDTMSLSSPLVNTAVISNLLAGVMYGHLIHEKYPSITFDEYLYGTLFGQLLQEGGMQESVINNEFNPSDIHQMMHNASIQQQYLAVGQGGPYQINDYSKRLPGSDTQSINDGALGLINYNALRSCLNYSIADQDQGVQTQKIGPQALDNVYTGPMIAAFYHFNDINRMQVNASHNWYQYSTMWHDFFNNEKTAPYFFNVVMNVVYNAGDYSPNLGTFLQNANKSTSFDVINDYSQSWSNYQESLGVDNPSEGNATYMRYPRQVNSYIDQLFNDNSSLKTHHMGFSVDNQLNYTVSDIEHVFVSTMQQLDYESKPAPSTSEPAEYTLVTAAQATAAFESAMKDLHLDSSSTLSITDDNQRKTFYRLLDAAITNIESTTGHQFDEVTKLGPQKPTPLPDLSQRKNYAETCGLKNWSTGASESTTYAKIPQGNGTCHVYACLQSGWCNDSCNNPYTIQKGTAWTNAWSDTHADIQC